MAGKKEERTAMVSRAGGIAKAQTMRKQALQAEVKQLSLQYSLAVAKKGVVEVYILGPIPGDGDKRQAVNLRTAG